MTGTTHSSTIDSLRPVRRERDASWYGTIGLLAACLGMLALASFMG
jgi:hypothetical protein